MIQKKNSKISYVYTHKMQVLMTDQNNINFEAVQFTHKMVYLKSVKVFFYMILINHFLFKNRIYCAESLDYSSIETPMGSLSLNEEQQELFNKKNQASKRSLRRILINSRN
jgi:predicted class III extradiol MEMO1 family dioxygenase